MPFFCLSAEPLLTVRAAVIFHFGLEAGAAAAAATISAGGTMPAALTAAGTVAAGAIGLLQQIIGER